MADRAAQRNGSHFILGFFLLLALAGCNATSAALSAKCARDCYPAGFNAEAGCVCTDGGWSACACEHELIQCTLAGGPGPKEWRLW